MITYVIIIVMIVNFFLFSFLFILCLFIYIKKLENEVEFHYVSLKQSSPSSFEDIYLQPALWVLHFTQCPQKLFSSSAHILACSSNPSLYYLLLVLVLSIFTTKEENWDDENTVSFVHSDMMIHHCMWHISLWVSTGGQGSPFSPWAKIATGQAWVYIFVGLTMMGATAVNTFNLEPNALCYSSVTILCPGKIMLKGNSFHGPNHSSDVSICWGHVIVTSSIYLLLL